jgi:hypothetical protein
MALFQNVRSLLIRLSPEPICNGCIAATLDEAAFAEVGHKTVELAVAPGFRRSVAIYSMCNTSKKVTRYAKEQPSRRNLCQ